VLSLISQIAQFYVITICGGIFLLIVITLLRGAYDTLRDRIDDRARRPD